MIQISIFDQLVSLILRIVCHVYNLYRMGNTFIVVDINMLSQCAQIDFWIMQGFLNLFFDFNLCFLFDVLG